MSGTLNTLVVFAAALALGACANTHAQNPLLGFEQVDPDAGQAAPVVTSSVYPAARVEHGRYLVNLLVCGSCHTDGALAGEPNPQRVLAGSGVGIATSNPMTVKNPAVVFPANLTPHRETGIGEWTLQQIVTMLQSGLDIHGSQALPVMPFTTYARLSAEDAEAIAMYLKSLPPVEHRVPENIRQGRRTSKPFVHFGVYRSRN